MPVPETETSRKRKAHTKSRAGCGNCKLRRVKCDEIKPSCQKCQSFGVTCDYDSNTPAGLHLSSGEAAFTVQIQPDPILPAPATAPPAPPNLPPSPPSDRIFRMLNHSLILHDSEENYLMTEIDLDLMRKFEERTVFSIGTMHTAPIYREQIIHMCMPREHSFLTHIVLTLVLAHDRALSDDPDAAPTTKASFHWYHASGLFSMMLNSPVPHGSKDALWGAAALLGVATIASSEAKTPEEAWPLAMDSNSDLDWLRMSEGKKEIWKIVDPLREDSVWRPAVTFEMDRKDKPTESSFNLRMDALYPFLTKLYDLDESAKTEGDPYHTAASIVGRLVRIECNYSTIMYFLSFMGHMDPAYRTLLHQKDAKALLLLAWWYAKLYEYPVWWLRPRASRELPSICLYLEKRHAEEEEITKLLAFPKMVCGLSW